MHERYPNLYKRARCATRLTQEGAAELLDISVESIKQYEGGRRVPPDEVVARMVEVYRLPWHSGRVRAARSGDADAGEPTTRRCRPVDGADDDCRGRSHR